MQEKQDQILKVADENSKEIQQLQHQMHDVVPRVEACEALSNEHSRVILALRREIRNCVVVQYLQLPPQPLAVLFPPPHPPRG